MKPKDLLKVSSRCEGLPTEFAHFPSCLCMLSVRFCPSSLVWCTVIPLVWLVFKEVLCFNGLLGFERWPALEQGLVLEQMLMKPRGKSPRGLELS